jgi:hypothetical protein
MMKLKDASLVPGGGIRGAIYGDTRGRFKDGQYVITSSVVSHKGNVYKTLYSTYEVEFAYVAPDTDAA